MGQIKLKAEKVFALDRTFYELEEQNHKFPLKIGYEVYKMAKQMSEVADFLSKRLFAVIDSERMHLNQLTDDERVIYNAVMESEVYIDPFNVSKDEFFSNSDVEATLSEIAYIDELFREN